jgi:hypothetical protein
MRDFITGYGFHFEENHLVAAMAACMDEMEDLLKNQNNADTVHIDFDREKNTI